MKEVLQSRGAKNVWAMMDECNGFLEAITYCIEEDMSEKIDFFHTIVQVNLTLLS